MSDSIFKTSSVVGNIALEFAPRVVELMNKQCPLLALLEKRPLPSNYFNWTVETNAMTAAIIGEGASLPAATINTFATAQAIAYQYGGSFMISDTAIRVGAMGTDPGGILSATNGLSRAISNSLSGSSSLGTLIYDGSGTSTIWGLHNVLGSTSDGYSPYGIDQSSVTGFASNVVDFAGAALDFNTIDQGLADMQVASGSIPDVWVCSPKTGSYLAKLGMTDKSIYAGNQTIAAVSGLVDPGYDVSKLQSLAGIPILRDRCLADGYIYGLELSDLYVGYVPAVVLPDAPSYVIDSVTGENGVTSLPFTVVASGRSTSASKWTAYTQAALIVQSPNRHIKCIRFSEPA